MVSDILNNIYRDIGKKERLNSIDNDIIKKNIALPIKHEVIEENKVEFKNKISVHKTKRFFTKR